MWNSGEPEFHSSGVNIEGLGLGSKVFGLEFEV